MFWLKKVIGYWLMPVPLCLALLVTGWCLAFFGRRRVLGKWLLGTGVVLLLLFSNRALSTWLVRPLETQYPAIPEFTANTPVPASLAACRYVLVLGSGHGDTPWLSAVNKLSTSAQGRLLEAIRILRVLPGAKLVVSGYGEPNRPSHAAVLAQAAESVGVAPERIIRFDTPRDTDDEAAAMRRLAGDAPFALVTSAWHMRRAMALMYGAGANPVACPADFADRPSPGWTLTGYGWDAESIGRSTRAVYERIGYLWVRLRGEAGAAPAALEAPRQR